MKSYNTGFGRCGMAFALCAVLLFAWPVLSTTAGGQGDAAAKEGANTIRVTGEETVHAQPDIAHVSLGVEAFGESAAGALATARERMQSVMDALGSAGIAEEDIQTANFSVYFERDPDVERRGAQATDSDAASASAQQTDVRPAGRYRVSNVVDITVRQLPRMAALLDAAVEAGANTVHGVSFTVSDPAPHRSEARRLAVEAARQKAEELAAAAGIQLGEVRSINDLSDGGSQPVYAMERGIGGQSTPIAPGQIEFSAAVEIVYSIAR